MQKAGGLCASGFSIFRRLSSATCLPGAISPDPEWHDY